MKVLGLDVSTKTGFAVISGGTLIEKGLIQTPAVIMENRVEDFSTLRRAEVMAQDIMRLIVRHQPDLICIEQTNAGRFRGAQKQLEFIHCLILFYLCNEQMGNYGDCLRYVDTSKWRSTLGVKLSKDQRKHNKNVKSKVARGKITPKHLAVAWANEKYGLFLKLKDNDQADAIALATFGHLNGLKPLSVNFDIDSIVLNK
jgi:Holliday junction resolvasome RuvABC endonuclease subunit